MAIYIEGMEMPKSCWGCNLHWEDDCYAGNMSISRVHYSDRSEYCPLIEVPDGSWPAARGEWREEVTWDDVVYVCSNCGEPWTLIDGTPAQNNMNFCPNCGADMRGSE